MKIFTDSDELTVKLLCETINASGQVEDIPCWIEVEDAILLQEVPEGFPDRLDSDESVRTFEHYAYNFIDSTEQGKTLMLIGHSIDEREFRRTATSSEELYQWLNHFQVTGLKYEEGRVIFFYEPTIYTKVIVTPLHQDCLQGLDQTWCMPEGSEASCEIDVQLYEDADATTPQLLPGTLSAFVHLYNGDAKALPVHVTFDLNGNFSTIFHASGKAPMEYAIKEKAFNPVTIGANTYRFRLLDPEKAKVTVYAANL